MWLSNRCSEALLPSRASVSGSELGWLPVIIEDPDGGRIVLYPHLPCVRMPSELRTREHWDGLALIASAEEVRGWPAEEKEDQDSPGVQVPVYLPISGVTAEVKFRTSGLSALRL